MTLLPTGGPATGDGLGKGVAVGVGVGPVLTTVMERSAYSGTTPPRLLNVIEFPSGSVKVRLTVKGAS